MSDDKMPEAKKDTSQPGREEEVIPQSPSTQKKTEGAAMTELPVKDKETAAETEGERRFKEGTANNNDTE
ncbi:MAG: hypothetical protein WKF88_03075 [Ferruginibacter sp.]